LVKILGNPLLLRAAVVFFCATFAFMLGMLFMRLLRKSISDEFELSANTAPSLESLPLHVYNTVIQQLKQQKHELHQLSQAEQQRARVSESFSQAVISNLSCGVLVFGTNGLVKTSNPAAKDILGFASATGMSTADIFRGAIVRDSAGDQNGEPAHLADEVDAVLHIDSGRRRSARAEYTTPTGKMRFLSVTVSPVKGTDGTLLGVACLINDLSKLEEIRRQQELRGELSVERALELRSSLTTIASYAQQLAANCDAQTAKRLAADIAEESVRLDRSIGGFLTERNPVEDIPARAAAMAADASGL
jgi:nitrogen fixation/metabolism regulation signal transduction histidine kinase